MPLSALPSGVFIELGPSRVDHPDRVREKDGGVTESAQGRGHRGQDRDRLTSSHALRTRTGRQLEMLHQ